MIIGCPAVTWLMQTLHLSLRNHLSAGLEYSKQLNKKDQKKEDDTGSSIYTSLIRHDEFPNLNICFLSANQEKKKNADHNMKCKTLHKINLLQTHTALKDRETKKERGNTHYHICLLTFICSTPAIQRLASHGEKKSCRLMVEPLLN